MFIQQFFDSRNRLDQTLAAHIAKRLSSSIAHRGRATLVVCGGTSPVGVFHALSQTPLDWSSVTVIPSDERWVSESDPASNAAMIRRELLRDLAADATLFSLYDENVDYAEAATVFNRRVSALTTPFDYVLLGMGADGHTASLFPDAPDIDAALCSSDACVLAQPPSQSQPRISLTPNMLLNSSAVGLLFFGQEKANVFAEASQPGELREFPVRSVLRQERVPVTTYFAM